MALITAVLSSREQPTRALRALSFRTVEHRHSNNNSWLRRRLITILWMWTAPLHLRLCPPNCRRHSSSSATITTYRRRSRRVAGVSRVAKILHRRPTRKRQWRSIVKSAVHQGKGQISFYNNRSPSPNCIFAFYFEPILRAYPPPSSSRHIFIYFVFFLLLSLPPNHRGHNATLSPLTKWSVAPIHFLNQFDEIVGTEKKSTSACPAQSW